MELALIALVPALAIFVVLLAVLPRRKCPKCKERLPRLRVPTSGRQFVHGGWTCPGCGTELDRLGRKIDP
jgi:hypothetical protein